MRTTDLPVISQVSDAGADDWVLDTLLLTGPVVIGLIVFLGRSTSTEVLALAYLVVFVCYIVYSGT